MAAEPHPYPEPRLWRVGPPVLAGALAPIVFVAILTLVGGPVLVVTVATATVLQLALMIGRGVYLRRAGRLADLSVRWHQFVFCWSTFTGFMYVLGDEPLTASAVINIATGFVFALFMLGVYVLSDRVSLTRSPSRGQFRRTSDRADS